MYNNNNNNNNSNNNTNQITDISTLQFIGKLRNFMHIVSIQSNGAAIALSGSGSGRICRRISGHIGFGRI